MKKPPVAPIPVSDAVAYTQNWRNFNGSNSVNGSPLTSYLANAFTFDLADVAAVLAESGCTYVRIYFGYNDPNPTPGSPIPMKVMLVGVDAEGNDIINPAAETAADSGIYDFAAPCPVVCDTNSPLS